MTEKNKKNPLPEPGPGANFMFQNRLFWIFLIVLPFIYYSLLQGHTLPTSINYTEFKDYLDQGKIEKVTIQDKKITGTMHFEDTSKDFETIIPFEDPELIKTLEKNEVTIQASIEETNLLTAIIINLLPWAIVIGFFVYSSRRLNKIKGGPLDLFGYGSSKAKIKEKTGIKTKYQDVAGLESAKKDLMEVAGFLKNPDQYQKLGAQLPKGVLLMGAPGTGKTLLARATAGEAGVPFYSITGSEFVEVFVGVGASRVRDLFKTARENAPSIIFIDEIDSIGRVRGSGLGGGNDEREQTLNQILSEMDGFSPNESVVVLAATNRPDVLDPALIRPGRFDRQVTLELPQKKAREAILKIHTQKIPLDGDVDLKEIAASTVSFSGADLKNLANEAALLAVREGRQAVCKLDFELARDKIILGSSREDLLQDDEKRVVAYHEAGHTLVAWMLPDTDPIRKVTIIPRGRSLGVTEQWPQEDRHNFNRHFLINRIIIALSGRESEKLVFDEFTTGAESDLKEATLLAQKMVCRWGMDEKLGPAYYKRGEEHIFLGREMTQQKDFSEDTARLIDEEIRKILSECEEKSHVILVQNRLKLDSLAQALIQKESLEESDLNKILGPHSPVKHVAEIKLL